MKVQVIERKLSDSSTTFDVSVAADDFTAAAIFSAIDERHAYALAAEIERSSVGIALHA